MSIAAQPSDSSRYDKAFVESVKKEEVLDKHGQAIPFERLISCKNDERAIVVFIRHYACNLCQEYVSAMVRDINTDKLEASNARISIISSGDPAMVEPYTKMLNCPFPVYSHPSKSLHKLFGMSRGFDRSETGSYITKSMPAAVWAGITSVFTMWTFASTGDISQNGGESIWTSDFQCIYSHAMKGIADHTSVSELLRRAGAQEALSTRESLVP